MWNPFDFTGKKIIVTGATSGIGKATAVKLSEYGADVMMIGRNEERLKETLSLLHGEGHRCFIKDFAEPGGYRELFDDIISDGRKIDGLVHSAGIAKILPVNSLTYRILNESMTINFYAFVEMVGILSKKKYHDKTSIVGISSIAAKSPDRCQGMYAATKAAMNVFVTGSAIELTDKNIRINTVMPGMTRTRMTSNPNDIFPADDLERIISSQLMGMSEPDDVANIILFLLSDASGVITGREIYADGGYIHFTSRKGMPI